MKKLLFITAIALATFITSCSDNDGTETDLVGELDMEAEATLEANFEDLSQIVDAGIESTGNGRIEMDEVLDCATITHDEVAKTITIDYGDGCVGPGGRTRSGIIRITYSENRFVPGAFRTTTLEGYSVDGVSIEGTRTVENISESIDADPKFSITLVGGKMTFEDETTATRDAARIRTWFRGNNPLTDEASIEGNASGTRRDGVSYTMEIISPIIYKRSCRANRVFIPVSGIKQFTSGDNVAIVDYGDGRCDNQVTITINGGDPIVKEITPKGKR